jgi:hypothetical protein
VIWTPARRRDNDVHPTVPAIQHIALSNITLLSEIDDGMANRQSALSVACTMRRIQGPTSVRNDVGRRILRAATKTVCRKFLSGIPRDLPYRAVVLVSSAASRSASDDEPISPSAFVRADRGTMWPHRSGGRSKFRRLRFSPNLFTRRRAALHSLPGAARREIPESAVGWVRR